MCELLKVRAFARGTCTISCFIQLHIFNFPLNSLTILKGVRDLKKKHRERRCSVVNRPMHVITGTTLIRRLHLGINGGSKKCQNSAIFEGLLTQKWKKKNRFLFLLC